MDQSQKTVAISVKSIQWLFIIGFLWASAPVFANGFGIEDQINRADNQPATVDSINAPSNSLATGYKPPPMSPATSMVSAAPITENSVSTALPGDQPATVQQPVLSSVAPLPGTAADGDTQQVSTPAPPYIPPHSDVEPSLGETEASRQAFANMIRNLMPLSPAQIRALRYFFDQSQRAAATEPGVLPPKPTSSAVIVNLSPGATPPVIRLKAGYVTSLVFLDSTGSPWPITAYDLGNPKSFNIQWDQKSNTLMVQALDSYQTANLAVMLQGENTPVMMTLLPGQQQVDYRVDLHVPGLGPNASPTMEDVPGMESPRLLDFLNGTPPPASQLLHVAGGESQAWVYGNHIFLRTRLTLVSPSWLATMSSPDGTHVYQIIKAPVILVSSHGKIIQLKIQGL